MGWKDTVDRAASEIGAKIREEAIAAKDAVNMVVDLRLQTGGVYPRETPRYERAKDADDKDR